MSGWVGTIPGIAFSVSREKAERAMIMMMMMMMIMMMR